MEGQTVEPQTEPQQDSGVPQVRLDEELQQQVTKELFCPECAAEGIHRTFPKPQGLARHRSSAHGVKGKSAATKRRNQQRRDGSKPGPRGRKAKSQTQFDKTAMLKQIAPDGMVPVATLGRIESWLAEGEAIYNERKR